MDLHCSVLRFYHSAGSYLNRQAMLEQLSTLDLSSITQHIIQTAVKELNLELK